jgi:hypothetical protein
MAPPRRYRPCVSWSGTCNGGSRPGSFSKGSSRTLRLVQESVPPTGRLGASSIPGQAETAAWRCGPRRPFASAVLSFAAPLRQVPAVGLGEEKRLDEIALSHPGALALAEIDSAGTSLTFVSMYGLLSDRCRKPDGYAITSVNRMISDLTPILVNQSTRIVLGGDLNISPQLLLASKSSWRRLARHRELTLQRLEAFGLVNATMARFGDFVQTHRVPRSAIPWQNDWLFLSSDLARRLTDLCVVGGPRPTSPIESPSACRGFRLRAVTRIQQREAATSRPLRFDRHARPTAPHLCGRPLLVEEPPRLLERFRQASPADHVERVSAPSQRNERRANLTRPLLLARLLIEVAEEHGPAS